ncbi:hypothetical protein ACRQ5Q_14560 [Bradyrhizobium sp. PMVTL-01]|uniref:hypothetical protein n=1 Tax=Bradyrhizobium sp. PMVTL-01 TaxID=3434999 RepID=UPI003F6FF158
MTKHDLFWHHELVGTRLIEAAQVMRRLPMLIWPKQFGTIWPSFDPLDDDESTEEGARYSHSAQPSPVRVSPSSMEIERAEEALGWPVTYLAGDREAAQAVGFWASKTNEIEETDIPSFVREGLKAISRGLKRDNVRVRV